MSINLTNLIKKFKKKKVFFVIPFIIILGSIVIFTAIRKPLYEIKATVKAEDSFGITPVSEEVLSRSLDKLGLLDSKRPDISIASLRNKISVNKEASSGIVEIKIKGLQPQELSKIVKEIADVYVGQINAKTEQFKKGILKKKEQELEEYKNNLKEQLQETKVRLEESERKMEIVQGEERTTVDKASDLKAQLAELENNRVGLLKMYTPAYPDVVRVDSEISAIKEKLKNLPDEPEGRLKLERELKDYQRIYNSLKEKLDEVNMKKIEELKDFKGGASVISYPDQVVLLTDIARKKTVIFIGLIIAFLAGLLSVALTIFLDASLMLPEEVHIFTNLAIAGIIPCIKPFCPKEMKDKTGLTLECEADQTIIEPYKRIYAHMQTSIFNDSQEGKSLLLTSAVQKEGKSIIASNLALAAAASGKKVLIIDANLDSPAIHTFFGITSRMPGFTDVLNKGATYGNVMRDVTDLVLGGVGLDRAIKLKGLDRLKIITAGSLVSDTTGLLKSQNLRGLIKELKPQFDYIIFDGPAVLNKLDSAIIAHECDATLLVYLLGKTPRNSLKLALAKLNSSKEQTVGASVSLKGVLINQCI